MNSVKDILYGYLIGVIWGRLQAAYRAIENREISDEESREFGEILVRRTPEIRDAIKKIANL